MIASEIIKQVVETSGALMIRNRKEAHIRGEDWQYDVKPLFSGSKKGWTIMDLFTAGAVLSIYNALSEEHRTKFNKIHLTKLIDFTWRHVK